MNKAPVEEEFHYSFNIWDLDKLNKSALILYLQGSNFEYSIIKNKEGVEILEIKDIDKFFDSDYILGAINKFQIKKENYEIFISVTTDYSPLYLELPKVITKIYRKLACRMRVSFIMDY
jgi:hypothetical protein